MKMCVCVCVCVFIGVFGCLYMPSSRLIKYIQVHTHTHTLMDISEE